MAGVVGVRDHGVEVAAGDRAGIEVAGGLTDAAERIDARTAGRGESSAAEGDGGVAHLDLGLAASAGDIQKVAVGVGDLTQRGGGEDRRVAVNAVDVGGVGRVIDDHDALAPQLAVIGGALEGGGAAGERGRADAVIVGEDRGAIELSRAGKVVGVELLGGVVGDAGDVAVLLGAVKGLAEQGGLGRAARVLRGGVAVRQRDRAGLGVDALPLDDAGRVLRVVDELRGIIAIHRLAGAQVGDLLVEALLLRVARDVDRPAVAAVLADVGVVAQRDEQHLAGLRGGDVGVRVEDAVALAADDALAVAILDVTLSPVTVNVGQVGRRAGESGHLDVAEQRDGDHLRHLGAGDVAIRVEHIVALAADDVQRVHDGNSFFMIDLVIVSEAGSVGANRGQAEGHDQRQYHRE